MDVELKEEYKQGWFGNAKIAAGTQIPGNNDDEFIEGQKPLFNGSVMSSFYNEKDQLTVIGGGNNARSYGDGVLLVIRGDEELNLPRGGVNTSWQLGANLNSDRIKGMTSTGLVSYNGTQAKLLSRSDRTTFREGDDLFTSNLGNSGGTSNIYKMSFELENKKKDSFTFHYEPTFYFMNIRKHSDETTSTSLGNELQNASRAFSGIRTLDYEAAGDITFGVKKLGKPKRSLTFTMDYDLDKMESDSYDRSLTTLVSSGVTNELNLDYDKDVSTKSISGNVAYVEPLGERWLIRTGAGMRYSDKNTVSDAYNMDGSQNSWYSSSTRSLSSRAQGNLRLQYSKDRTSLQIGGYVYAIENEIRATAYGMSTTTGKDDWYYSYSPYINLQMFPKGYNINMTIQGTTSTPSNTSMMPSFNLASPTRITLGNIYLEPNSRQSLNITINKSFKKTQSMFNFNGNFYMTEKDVVNASWFDSDGIRYSVPVNARKNGLSEMFNGMFMMPLDKAKKLRVTLSSTLIAGTNVGYQSKRTLDGIDTEAFDYTSFMESFWGDSKGSRFYSGQSGFSESKTTTIQLYPSLSLRYSPTASVAITTGYRTGLTKSKYSLDPRANMNLWTDRYILSGEFTLPREYEICSNLSYNTYRGDTSKSYAKPYLNWDMRFQKSVKAMSFGLELFNILNQDKSFSRTASEEYMIDSYNNRLGRYFLLTFSYRFGKMNAAKNSAAQSNLWKMSY